MEPSSYHYPYFHVETASVSQTRGEIDQPLGSFSGDASSFLTQSGQKLISHHSSLQGHLINVSSM